MFTLEEANALVPRLQVEFGELARLRGEIAPIVAALGDADQALALIEKGAPVPPGREAEAGRLRKLISQVHAVVERLGSLGCVVKDLEMGLVDFHWERDGETVFLCWQLGEPAVAHWHGLGDGYAGRQPIEGVEVEGPTFRN
jgi:hypothetical protein